MSETAIHIFFGFVFVAIIYAGWKQIPPEDAETVAAREKYGKAP